jgi:hypothetical protein
MTRDDYKSMMDIHREIAMLHLKAFNMEKDWKPEALKIARERIGLPIKDVIFEYDKIVVCCHGTGIYSTEEWYESYPIELLFKRLGI